MFQKYKKGNIAFILMLSLIISFIVFYMVNNVVQIKLSSKIELESYKKSILTSSTCDVVAALIIDSIDGKTYMENDYIFSENTISEIKDAAVGYTGNKTDISINNPTASNVSELICNLDNHTIVITGIKTTNYFLNEHNYYTVDCSDITIRIL